MGKRLNPLKLDLLVLTPDKVRGLKPIKVLDIFEGFTKNFHQDGLFSTSIFGRVGDERRNRTFSYIDLNIEIYHPLIFKIICDLKELYGEVIAGRAYAVFDEIEKDLVRSDAVNGFTGMSYFMSIFDKIELKKNNSIKREFSINVLNKHKDKRIISKIPVMPAGFRDYTVDENDQPSQDEINGLYRSVLSLSNIVSSVNESQNDKYIDNIRYQIQNGVMAVFEYIKAMLEGKGKIVQGKWAQRKIFDSTRNVLTSFTPTATEIDGPGFVRSDQTQIGLQQYLRNIMPMTVYYLKTGFLSEVFPGSTSPAVLVNKKTLKKENVNIPSKIFDQWMTYDGIEAQVARYGKEALRHDYLEYKDYWFGLIFKGRDGTYKLFQDIDELPEKYKDQKDRVFPITFTEMLFLSVYKKADETPLFVTRYPVIGYGGIYPSFVYLKSTINSEVREELDFDWERSGQVCNEFPIYKENFFSSMAVSPKQLKRMGGDHDGDMTSGISTLTEESKKEIAQRLSKANHFIGVDGKMVFSSAIDPISLVFKHMTAAASKMSDEITLQ